ncbi:MAG: hypothetical protein Q4G70_14530 [Pseudomonadota bacterium]|nr:hypothetical protein [Pseudomonadota bacterium]
MTESSQPIKLAVYAKKVNVLILKVTEQRKCLEREMRKLRSKGLSYAKPHWRDDKYLYLLHPSKVGEPRRREYVGTDPKRIAAAQAAIGRAEQYDALAHQLRQVEGAIERAAGALSAAVNALERW